MPVVNLTDKKLKSLKPENERVEYWDDSLPGFGVRVTPNGEKTFCVMYRIGGRQRRFSLGTYPQIPLAKARDMARDAFEAVRKGKDPVQEKKVQEAESIRARLGAKTFARLAQQYLEEYAKLNKKSWKEDEKIINHLLKPEFGTLNVKEITRTHVRSFLQRMAARAKVHANRAHACLRKIFNWAIKEEIVDLAGNPASGITRPGGKEIPKERALSDAEMKALWRDLDKETSQASDVLRLILLTGQRPGEVMGARWEEIDADQALWTIPGSRTKNGLANAVPLSPQAIRILESHRNDLEAQRRQRKERGGPDEESPFVFPTHLLTKHAKAPIGYIRKAVGRIHRRLGMKPFTAHDLRRTCATRLGQMGVPGHIIARILNHKPTDVTSAVYNQYEYLKEKREALDAWGARVVRITSELQLVDQNPKAEA